MLKYVYPAIFKYDENDKVYYVNFPDLEGCYTDGETLIESIENAEDVLNLMLLTLEKNNVAVPTPSKLRDFTLNENEFVSLIKADILEYQKSTNSKSINKNVTLPQWLNERSEKANINFSQTLQEALKDKLGI